MTGHTTKLSKWLAYTAARFCQTCMAIRAKTRRSRIISKMGVKNVSWLQHWLNTLINKSFVSLGSFLAQEDQGCYAYILTPKGLPKQAALSSRFQKRVMERYEALKEEIDTLQNRVELCADMVPRPCK